MMLMACIGQAVADEPVNLTIADATASAGSTITIPVSMSGMASGYQFEVYPPEGVTLTQVQRGEKIKVRKDDDEYIFSFEYATRDNGGRFILCYSMKGVLTTEAGEVANLVFTVGKDVKPGIYSIQMKDAECAHAGVVLSTYREKTSTLTVTESTAVEDITMSKPLSGKVSVFSSNGQLLKNVEGTVTANSVIADQKPGTYILKCDDVSYKVTKE